MKLLSLIVFSLICYNTRNCGKPYSIKIWDFNYSLSYTNVYIITNENIQIKRISSVRGEKDKPLLNKKLLESQCKIMTEFLDQHKINTFKNKYSNPLVQDGDRKKIEIKFDRISKTIEVSNFYRNELAELFNSVNKIVPKDLQIMYNRR